MNVLFKEFSNNHEISVYDTSELYGEKGQFRVLQFSNQACALCCALPILGSAAFLGISSFFLNPFVILSLALILVLIGVVVYRWRKVNGVSCSNPGCSCNSCAKG